MLANALEDCPRPPPVPEPQQAELLGSLACEIEPETVEWIWQRRISRGKLTMLEGDPATNKSTLAVDMAARISVGRGCPDGSSCETGYVIIFAAEDGAGDTLVPRLMAAEANLFNVRIVPAVHQNDDSSLTILTLPDHIKAVEATISSSNAVLAIIDPLNSFLSSKIDSHRDQDVRRVLAALGAMAERTNCAF